MNPVIKTRRSYCARLAAGCLPGLLSFVSHAQPAAPNLPLPPIWEQLGLTQWPSNTSLITLQFDEIVLPGAVAVVVSSQLRFTLALGLFRRFRANPVTVEQIEYRGVVPGQQLVLKIAVQVARTQTLIALAKTPIGWFRTEREVKVGRAG